MEVSDIIFSKNENERVCNICQWNNIFMDNRSGVCSTCAENRLNDKIWTQEEYKLWEIDELISFANGYIYIKKK
jgi:hypothetical protein